MGTIVKPDGHKEIYVYRGDIVMGKYESTKQCGKEEYKVFVAAKNITFNDIYVAFTDETGKVQYIELNGWFISVIAREYNPPAPAPQQMSIYELLGGTQ